MEEMSLRNEASSQAEPGGMLDATKIPTRNLIQMEERSLPSKLLRWLELGAAFPAWFVYKKI